VGCGGERDGGCGCGEVGREVKLLRREGGDEEDWVWDCKFSGGIGVV